MMERMQEIGTTITGLKRKMATWAKKKGLQGNRNIQRGCIVAFILILSLFKYVPVHGEEYVVLICSVLLHFGIIAMSMNATVKGRNQHCSSSHMLTINLHCYVFVMAHQMLVGFAYTFA